MKIMLCEVSKNDAFAEPICAHPDMNLLHLGDSQWLVTESAFSGIGNKCSNLELEIRGREESEKILNYPNDVFFNCAIMGNHIIMNKKYSDSRIVSYAEKHNLTLIDVKQGYCKCAICIVDENSLITEDEGIYRAIKKQSDLDILLLKKHEIKLNGYEYGFIGGASGKLDQNILAFTGMIELHTEYQEIKTFCERKGISILSLSNEALYDYGSLLPISENTG